MCTQPPMQCLRLMSNSVQMKFLVLFFRKSSSAVLLLDLLPRDISVRLRGQSQRKKLIFNFAAHMNLNDEYLPYKYLIGEIIIDVSNGITLPYYILTIHRKTKPSVPW